MTVTSEAPAAERSRTHRRTVVRGVVLAIAIVLVVALVLAERWWTHPDVIPDVNGISGMVAKPVDRAALTVNVTPPTTRTSHTTFTIRHLSAHLTLNTAAATATFEICDVKPSNDGLFYIWPRRSVGRFCSDIRPVGGSFRFTYPGDQAVLLTLTPTRSGRVHLDHVDFSESLGKSQLFRRGTDTSAVDVHFAAR